MKPFRPYAVIAGVLAVAAYAYCRWAGVAGFALGLFASAFGLIGWWRMIRLMGGLPVTEERAAGKLGTFLTVLVFLIKIPLFVCLAIASARLDSRAVPCFLAGLVLVYSAMVGWALRQSPDRH